jgi:hypothetical protein
VIDKPALCLFKAFFKAPFRLLVCPDDDDDDDNDDDNDLDDNNNFLLN